jgi:glycosyltransferase involved in cell wall biosynthesis
VSGLTFIPGDPESLAAAISSIASDRTRMKRMGEMGYLRLMERFHIRQNLESTERIYARQVK